MTHIDIVLATYNGAAYLDDQIESIFAQSHQQWRLLVRDDGSSDNTGEILTRYRDRDPDRIILLNDGDGNLGYVQNFSRLLESSDGDYVALCDQDDVWLPDKLALSLEKMQDLETRHGIHMPILVFSDLKVVDEALEPIGDSFWDLQYIDPDRAKFFSRILLQNVVTGCTALLNRPLTDLAVPIPEEATVHDWWIALVAAAFGVIEPVRVATVLYRQHGQNSLGVRAFRVGNFHRLALEFLRNYRRRRHIILERFDQADAFARHFGNEMSAEERCLLERIATLPDMNLLKRSRYAIQDKVLPRGFARALFFLLFSFR